MAALFIFAVTVLAAQPETEIRVRLKRQQDSVELTGVDLSVSPPSAFFESEVKNGFHRAKITRRTSGLWIVKWDHVKKPFKIQEISP